MPAPLPPMAAREDDEDEDEDDDNEGAVVGPQIQAHVNLAQTITRRYTFIFAISITII